MIGDYNMIEYIYIKNFKCFGDVFELKLKNGPNIIVGDNEQGKSTILEAIHLVLTGFFRGKLIKNNLNQFIFNQHIVNEYLASIKEGNPLPAPEILIEVYFEENSFPETEGDDFMFNTEKGKAEGIYIKIALSDLFREEYELFIKEAMESNEDIHGLPIEYYEVTWRNFARKSMTGRSVPVRSALIDVGFSKFQNGSDMYISRIIRDILEPNELVGISQAFRKTNESFANDESMIEVNNKLTSLNSFSEKKVSLSVDSGLKSTWQGNLITKIDDTPFDYIGKGEQAIIKTELSLSSKIAEKASVILLEEPECHISHTKLNKLLSKINEKNENKQFIVTTHSSFVSNKLGIDNLILIDNLRTTTFSDLSLTTESFFKKVAGYDTLRMILCKKALLVEGDSDELVVQKAYIDKYGKLPIEDEIEIISVGTSFLRFLEIAEKTDSAVSVITDNDGNIEGIERKYQDYLEENQKDNISICYDTTEYSGKLVIGSQPYNYNTLEPLILNANSLEKLNNIFGTNYQHEDDLRIYMKKNKTECALKIFETSEKIDYPEYIMRGIS